MELKLDITLTSKQKEIWDAMHSRGVQIVVCPMSRQIGKTVIAEVLLLEKLFKEKTISAYISPSFSQGRKFFSEITELLQGSNVSYKANASTLSIQVDGAGKLQFFSMESPTAIRGYTVLPKICRLRENKYIVSTLLISLGPVQENHLF